MAYFDELNVIVLGVIGEYMLNNQNLCKLLYYYSDDKTPNYNPFNEPDIEDTTKLLFTHIYPVPKFPDTTTTQQCYITVTLTGGNSMESNTRYRHVNIQFDIVCHLKQWTMYGGFRPYYIAAEIDKMFNYQFLTIPIIGRSRYYGFRVKDYSSYYYGLNLIYELTIDSNLECDSQSLYAKVPFLGNINNEL